MAEDLLTSIIDVLDRIRDAGVVKVKFTKKDGTERIMKCTLDFDQIPNEHKPKKVDVSQILKLAKNAKIVHVFDLEKIGWRSIPLDRVEWLDVDNFKFKVRL